jgi:hypothetical protein
MAAAIGRYLFAIAVSKRAQLGASAVAELIQHSLKFTHVISRVHVLKDDSAGPTGPADGSADAPRGRSSSTFIRDAHRKFQEARDAFESAGSAGAFVDVRRTRPSKPAGAQSVAQGPKW